MKHIINIFLISLIVVVNCQAATEDRTCANGVFSGGRCECYMGYFGSNCTEKACPYGPSETDSPFGDLDYDGYITDKRIKTDLYPMGFGIRESGSGVEHPYRECSNAGKCDRKTGTCSCNPGYDGSACQRRGCIATTKDKSVCSGHGICLRGKDLAKLADGVDIQDGWALDFNYRCVCYRPYNGTFCEILDCEYGYDPAIYTTDFLFSFTLQSATADGNADGNSISHYYEFTYRGLTYKSAIVSKFTGICPESGKVDSEKSRLFKDELYKKISIFPYFSVLNVELKCTDGVINKADGEGYSAGKFLTVTIKLDYINIDQIRDMEFKVYKEDGQTTAIKDGVKKADGTIDSTSPYALWLMRYSRITGKEITCYTNSIYKYTVNILDTGSSEVYIKSPINLNQLCPASPATGVTVSQISTTASKFAVTGQTLCSGKGKCDNTVGKCICDKNYYGTACSKKSNV